MLNRWNILCGIFGILVVLSVPSMALGQLQSNTTSNNPALLELQLTIINAINDAKTELNANIANLDKDVAVLRTELNGTETRLNAEINALKNQMKTLRWLAGGMGVVLLAIFFKIIWPNRTEKSDKVADRFEGADLWKILQKNLRIGTR